MNSLTIVQYDPISALHSSNRYRPKATFKKFQMKLDILPNDSPQLRATMVTDEAGGLRARDKDPDNPGDDNYPSLERHDSHGSVRTDPSQGQNCSQNSKEGGISVSRTGEYDVPA